MNTTETHHMLQPPKNSCTIVVHNSRERLLAVSLIESLNRSLRINDTPPSQYQYHCNITMSGLTETSLTSMKLAFLSAPDPIQGIPRLASLINLMLHICRCSQTHKTPASARTEQLRKLGKIIELLPRPV